MISMKTREQLFTRLEDLFLHFQSSMVSNFDADDLSHHGVDSCQFNLMEETVRGSMHFRPMSQERLNTLHMQPDFEGILFDRDCGRPIESDSYMVQYAIIDQLFPFLYEIKAEVDSRKADSLISWEEAGSVHLARTVLYK